MVNGTLLRLASNQSYEDFKERVMGNYYIIPGLDLTKLYLVANVLYLEQRLSADDMRDLAQIISSILDTTKENELKEKGE